MPEELEQLDKPVTLHTFVQMTSPFSHHLCCHTRHRLVVHTMPVELAEPDKRPQQLSSNESQLKCGSIFFKGGLFHQDGHHIPNAGEWMILADLSAWGQYWCTARSNECTASSIESELTSGSIFFQKALRA